MHVLVHNEYSKEKLCIRVLNKASRYLECVAHMCMHKVVVVQIDRWNGMMHLKTHYSNYKLFSI